MPAVARHSLIKCTIVPILTALVLTACGNDNAKPEQTKPEQPKTTNAVANNSNPSSDNTANNTINNPPTNTPADVPKPPTQKAVATTDSQILAQGKVRYDTSCHLCHAQGLLNSPKLTEKALWQPRLAKGMDTLKHNAIHGFGKMPAQAVDGVSEKEVAAAVEYMVSQIKK